MPYTPSPGKFINTPEGGLAIRVVNNTGAASIRGSVVCPSKSVASAVSLCPADDPDVIGVMYSVGVADGGYVYVVIYGLAEVLLEDNTGSTVGNWMRMSVTEGGTADGTNAEPPGGGVTEIDRHFREIGHSAQTISAGGVGTNVLCFCWLHFN